MLKKSDLHEYQELAIDFLYEHDKALAIMPTGSGKTGCVLTTLQEMMAEGLIKRPLVVAPIRVAQLVWPAELDAWEHLYDFNLVYMAGPPKEWDKEADPLYESRLLWGAYQHAKQREDKRKPETVEKVASLKKSMGVAKRLMRRSELLPELHLTSFENLQWLCDSFEPGEWPFDAIIFDEIGKLKNPKSARFKALKKHAKHFKIVWGMTATPAPEGMENLFTQVYIVDGGKRWGRSFYQWRRNHFMQADYHGYNWIPLLGMNDKLYRDIDDLAFRIPDEMLSYRKSVVPVHIDVVMPKKVQELYKSMEKKMVVELEDGVDITAMSKASAAMKCRQIAQGFIYDEGKKPTILHEEKAHALADLIDSMQREPLLIAYEFEEDFVAIQKVWKNIPHIGKGVSKGQAEINQRDWNAGKLPVMAVHPRSAGHGLNLQAGGHNVCWFTFVWSLDDYQQTNERIDRQGQKYICYAHHIKTVGTSDARVYRVLESKHATQQGIIQAIRSV